MLCVYHPPTCLPERRYIYDVLLRGFLGLDYCMQAHVGAHVRITLQGDPYDTSLLVADVLFQTPPDQWLTAASLPRQPLAWWDSSCFPGTIQGVPRKVPIIYGRAGAGSALYTETEGGAALGLDIFGSAFFMLTRYEELVKPARDRHGRFPAGVALAFQERFLERPIVNEYLEILWGALTRLWPALQRKSRHYRVLLSHDVDRPHCTLGRVWFYALRSSVADIVIRRDVALSLRRLHFHLRSRRGLVDGDPCDTFDFIMSLSEKHGRQSAFYFIADRSAGAIDGNYRLEDPWIRCLLRRIHERGHEVGLHPSYNTYRDPAQTRHEFHRLVQVLAAEGIHQQEWGGRQHYLRWENPTTWQNWADAGPAYDSTLSFADHVGFRCGICYEYSVFNLRTRQRLNLRERPLIVMEGTLFDMGLSWEASCAKIVELSRVCKQFGGDFTLLWHNSSLMSRHEKYWYSVVCASL